MNDNDHFHIGEEVIVQSVHRDFARKCIVKQHTTGKHKIVWFRAIEQEVKDEDIEQSNNG